MAETQVMTRTFCAIPHPLPTYASNPHTVLDLQACPLGIVLTFSQTWKHRSPNTPSNHLLPPCPHNVPIPHANSWPGPLIITRSLVTAILGLEQRSGIPT